jgi:4-diphosphocytidyl-2-C-methyl-D-erythritol kinase
VSLSSLSDIPAPAKLNLFLHVVGRRPDGYHLLESVFVLIDWQDTLHLERRSDGRLARHDLGDALPADDLCLRAARALQAASGTAYGADISILKRLPAGAGMGGGSSDAASVLLALNRLWGLNWPRARLLPLAQGLGADVPFFVFGRNALVQGIGEQLAPLDLPPQTFAVVKPAASIATASIFGSPLLRRDTPSVILMGSLDSMALAGLSGPGGGFGHNDLQPPAEAACAEVVQAARWLERQFGNSRMTGSGSAVFARVGADVCPAATWPSDTAQALPDGWVGRLCRSLPQHPLLGWAD